VPRWLHYWAVLTATGTLVLLALGQLVTSFKAGMADPIWPTEPWYLFVVGWQEPSRGYLIEHSHRIAGFTVGGLVAVLALGLWWTNPRRATRWGGLAAILVLLAGFGQFHGGLIAQRDLPPQDVKMPLGAVAVALAGLIAVLALAVTGVVRKTHLGGLRLLGVLALVGVMIQGLLGGLRVMLDALVGTDLATVHGVFAQVVFGLLVTLAVLTAKPPTAMVSRPLAAWSVVLAAVLFVQVVLGALVRHDPTPFTQRLHYFTAFLATALAVWLLVSIFREPGARARVSLAAWALGGLIALQLVLGVEAWMAKFGAYTLPELVRITTWNATIRTAHALVGTLVLATTVALAVRLRQPAASPVPTPSIVDAEWYEAPAGRAEAVATRFRRDTP
jgi:heme A synthase